MTAGAYAPTLRPRHAIPFVLGLGLAQEVSQ